MNGISVQQIEYFLTVANCRSISHAAKLMYISQPALSNWIKQFEQSLGMQLFERSNRGIKLTQNGLRLYAEFDQIYNDFRISISSVISKYSGQNAEMIKIGCLHFTDTIVAAEIVRQTFARRCPEQQISFEYFNYRNLTSKLLTGELDLVFTQSFDVVGHPEIDSVCLRPIDVNFYVPASWQVSELDEDTKRMLASKTLLLEVNNSYEMNISQCRANGFVPQKAKYASGILQLVNMVCDGEGFIISGSNVPICEENKKRLVRIRPDYSESRPCVYSALAWKKGEPSEKVQKLIDIAESVKFDTPEVDRLLHAAKTKWYSGEPIEMI